MGQKAEYRSAIRSRRMIREAYTQLLKEKDLSRITVTDIVKQADLNRATFYAHYPDVRGVTEEIENEIIEKMLEVLKEFRFTNFFHNPATIASQNQPLSGGGCRLLPYPCPRKRFGNVRGKTEKGVCRPHALRQRHPGIHAAVADG